MVVQDLVRRARSSSMHVPRPHMGRDKGSCQTRDSGVIKASLLWGAVPLCVPTEGHMVGVRGACPDQGEQSPARGVAWERAAVLGMTLAWRAQRSSRLREGGAEPASRAPAAAPRAAAANRACRGTPARALTEPCAPGPPRGTGASPALGPHSVLQDLEPLPPRSFRGPQGPGPAWPRGGLWARGVHAPLSLCGRLLWFLLPQPLSEAPPGSRALSVCLSVRVLSTGGQDLLTGPRFTATCTDGPTPGP